MAVKRKHAAIPEQSPRVSWVLGATVLLGLDVLMFADLLLPWGHRIISQYGTDLFQQYIHWRTFGFGELAKGNVALWNPHVFCGLPFVAGFQSALFYPPNIVFLLLPVGIAVNVCAAVHVYLAGLFMLLWARRRGLGFWASLTAGGVFMFCGDAFMHLRAGHLTMICAGCWVPLVLLAVDGLLERPDLKWILVGGGALAMQVLAGFPQYVFYTGIVVAIYAGLNLIRRQNRLAIVVSMVGMAAMAAGISAIQWMTAMGATPETTRSHGLDYAFSSSCSLPPENLIGYIVPLFFGDIDHVRCWAREYLWEVTPFVGITTLVLGTAGIAGTDRKTRRYCGAMVVIILILALGAYTPLFWILYHVVPGYDSFRGSTKYLFFASAFWAMLAGMGLDALPLARHSARRIVIGIVTVAVVLALGGAILWVVAAETLRDSSWIARAMKARVGMNTGFEGEALRFAAIGTLIAAAISLVVAAAFRLSNRRRAWACLLAVLAVAEVFAFSRMTRASFDERALGLDQLRGVAVKAGGGRILNIPFYNAGMSVGLDDIWGYDSCVLRRYVEFMAFTQGQNPDEATRKDPSRFVRLRQPHPLYRMLRLKVVATPQKGRLQVAEVADPMETLTLVHDYRIEQDRDAIFAVMSDPSFDPTKVVVLESEPGTEIRQPDAPGWAKALRSGPDFLEVEIRTMEGAILLISGAYAEGWRAWSLESSGSEEYNVVPANYALRAVPLTRGHHRLRLEYRPFAYDAGWWVSVVSVGLCAGLIAVWWRRGWRFGRVPKIGDQAE